VTDPVEILDNMRTIVEREMLVHGTYLDPFICRPDLAEQGAICGGRRACAIGSLWLAAGVDLEPINSDIDPDNVFLPGCSTGMRHEFMEDKPHLRLAYRHLNQAAREYAEHHNVTVAWDADSFGWLEALFESGSHALGAPLSEEQAVDRAMLLEVIATARRMATA
jgi:hypothetical protein